MSNNITFSILIIHTCVISSHVLHHIAELRSTATEAAACFGRSAESLLATAFKPRPGGHQGRGIPGSEGAAGGRRTGSSRGSLQVAVERLNQLEALALIPTQGDGQVVAGALSPMGAVFGSSDGLMEDVTEVLTAHFGEELAQLLICSKISC